MRFRPSSGQVLPRVRERFPDAYIVGEMIHGDYSAYVAQGQLDSVTQYELWKAIWSSLNDHNLHELDWTLGRNNEFLDQFVPPRSSVTTTSPASRAN